MTLRRFASRTGFAHSEEVAGAGEVPPRQERARRSVALVRIALAPLAAAAAAVAGAIFLVLLPVCGIASIAEGLARHCWRAACDTLTHTHRGIVSHR